MIEQVMREVYRDVEPARIYDEKATAVIGEFKWIIGTPIADFVIETESQWQCNLNFTALMHYALSQQIEYRMLAELWMRGERERWYISEINGNYLVWCGLSGNEGYIRSQSSYRTCVIVFQSVSEAVYKLSLESYVSPHLLSSMTMPQERYGRRQNPYHQEVPF